MALDTADLEGDIEGIYDEARCGRDEVLPPSKLATRIFGRGCIVEVSNMIGAGELARSGSRWFIGVRRGLPRSRIEWIIGHEMGHWRRRVEGRVADEDEEAACDYIGAGLILRRRAFIRAAVGREHAFAELAKQFRTTETMVALRVGETLSVPVAVVTPHLVRARGVDQSADQLRALARSGGPGVTRVRLTDDRRRVALVGDSSAA